MCAGCRAEEVLTGPLPGSPKFQRYEREAVSAPGTEDWLVKGMTASGRQLTGGKEKFGLASGNKVCL